MFAPGESCIFLLGRSHTWSVFSQIFGWCDQSETWFGKRHYWLSGDWNFFKHINAAILVLKYRWATPVSFIGLVFWLIKFHGLIPWVLTDSHKQWVLYWEVPHIFPKRGIYQPKSLHQLSSQLSAQDTLMTKSRWCHPTCRQPLWLSFYLCIQLIMHPCKRVIETSHCKLSLIRWVVIPWKDTHISWIKPGRRRASSLLVVLSLSHRCRRIRSIRNQSILWPF